jgi:hypothetical protein
MDAHSGGLQSDGQMQTSHLYGETMRICKTPVRGDRAYV